MHVWKTPLGQLLPGDAELAVHAARPSLRRDRSHGFMKSDEIIDISKLQGRVDAPMREGVAVHRAAALDAALRVVRREGAYTADQVVVASGGYIVPIIPRAASGFPADHRLHSEQYRSAQALPEGAVLVVGSGQSGAQIAEDLWPAARCIWPWATPRAARGFIAAATWSPGSPIWTITTCRWIGIRCGRRARQHQPLCDRARRRPRHRSAEVRPRRHGAVRPHGGVDGRESSL